MTKSDLEEDFYLQLTCKESLRRDHPVRQYRFYPPRRWTFDFAYPKYKIAVEVEGGTWINGRHNRPQGFANDCEKYNTAVLDGWRVLRFVGAMITDGSALAVVEEILDKGKP